MRFDRVITTGLARTVETARLVVDELEHALADPEFAKVHDLEELRSGDVGVIPDDEIEEAFLMAFRGLAPHDASFLGGETIGSLVNRVASAMDRLQADESWHTVLLVAHGGVNRAILSSVLAGPLTFLGHLEQSPRASTSSTAARSSSSGPST